MNNLLPQTITELTGFDSRGIFVGSASIEINGNWYCTNGKDHQRCLHEETARQWLYSKGAVRVEGRDGMCR